MSDQIRIDGFFADGSITAKIDGEEYYGLTEVGPYKVTIEEKLLYGMNKDRGVRGRTKGVKKPEKVTFTGPVSTTRAIRKAAAAKAKNGRPSGYLFPITLSFADADETHSDLFKNCRIIEEETKPPTGDSGEALMETLTVQPEDIVRDGLPL